MAHSVYNLSNDKLVFINSYNNTAFIKYKNNFNNINHQGILKKAFQKDGLLTSESFLDSSRIDNFNKYFIHSIHTTEDYFYINYYKYNGGNFEELAIQKYNYKGIFKSEFKLSLSELNDKLINISKVNFKSHKILTKWQKGRWKIIDLSEFID